LTVFLNAANRLIWAGHPLAKIFLDTTYFDILDIWRNFYGVSVSRNPKK
jgi:hypothetical protein